MREVLIADFVLGLLWLQDPGSVKLITEWPKSKQAPTFPIPHRDEITVLYTTKEKKQRKKRPVVSFSFPRRVIKAYSPYPLFFKFGRQGS